MKSWKHLEINHQGRRKTLRGWELAAAAVVCLYGATGFVTASAQSTTGRIYGQAPAGETVTAQSTTGLRRHIVVKSSGHYTISALPVGVYTVVLDKNGTVVDQRTNIPISVGRGAEVDFACPQDQCEASEGGNSAP